VDRTLRTTFDTAAELYERARPSYPDELFDDLVELAGLKARSRVVEIGCGTGKATLPLAGRGLRIVCVELGTSLAAIAQRKLALFPGVQIVNADFETWRPERADYDAVVAFTGSRASCGT
jgi:16S rRNA A1518/A1519 N6-dimethyltransferase RsmA/KsgA/DIM1 with predicted DNA glycosylase/AP lyase activity